jgi:pimeloyl-ACP methyl ester carboxylesterase
VPARRQGWQVSCFGAVLDSSYSLLRRQRGESTVIAENVTFFNGELRLAGTLYRPNGTAPCPMLIVLHSARGATRRFAFYQHLIRRLPAAGIAVFLYDRRGSGESTGSFETADFSDLASDAIGALDVLTQRSDIDRRRIGVYGISQGGWIAPIVASQRQDIRCIVIVSGCAVTPAKQMGFVARNELLQSGFSETDTERAIALYDHLNDYYRGRLPYDTMVREINEARKESWISFVISDSSELPENPSQTKWYYERDFDPLPFWQRVQQPTLFVFGGRDRWVPVEESISMLERETRHLRHTTFKRFDGINHFMGTGDDESSPSVSREYLKVLLDWLGTHLVQI